MSVISIHMEGSGVVGENVGKGRGVEGKKKWGEHRALRNTS